MGALARWRFWQVALLGLGWLLLAPILVGGGLVLAGTVLDLVRGHRDAALTVSLSGWSAVTGLCLPPVLLVACWFRARSVHPPVAARQSSATSAS